MRNSNSKFLDVFFVIGLLGLNLPLSAADPDDDNSSNSSSSAEFDYAALPVYAQNSAEMSEAERVRQLILSTDDPQQLQVLALEMLRQYELLMENNQSWIGRDAMDELRVAQNINDNDQSIAQRSKLGKFRDALRSGLASVGRRLKSLFGSGNSAQQQLHKKNVDSLPQLTSRLENSFENQIYSHYARLDQIIARDDSADYVNMAEFREIENQMFEEIFDDVSINSPYGKLPLKPDDESDNDVAGLSDDNSTEFGDFQTDGSADSDADAGQYVDLSDIAGASGSDDSSADSDVDSGQYRDLSDITGTSGSADSSAGSLQTIDLADSDASAQIIAANTTQNRNDGNFSDSSTEFGDFPSSSSDASTQFGQFPASTSDDSIPTIDLNDSDASEQIAEARGTASDDDEFEEYISNNDDIGTYQTIPTEAEIQAELERLSQAEGANIGQSSSAANNQGYAEQRQKAEADREAADQLRQHADAEADAERQRQQQAAEDRREEREKKERKRKRKDN